MFRANLRIALGILLLVLCSPSWVGIASAGSGIWTSHGPGVPIHALAIDPQTPTILYAGTIAAYGSGGSVFKSPDGGNSWNATGLASTDVMALVIDPQNPMVIYAGTNHGVYKSINGGQLWDNPLQHCYVPPSTYIGLYVQALAVDPQNTATLYASLNLLECFGVIKSTDGGGHWTYKRDGLPVPSYVVSVLVIDPQNPNTLYAGTWGGGVFKSTNGGDNWSAANGGLPSTPYVWALAIDPQNPAIVYAGLNCGGVFKSTDRGQNWNAMNAGLTSLCISSLAIDPRNTATIYAGTKWQQGGEGVFKSVDGGGHWSAYSDGLANRSISALAIDPQNPGTLHAATGSGVFDIQGQSRTYLPFILRNW